MAEYFDVGQSRALAWARRPQAAALLPADPQRQRGGAERQPQEDVPGRPRAQGMQCDEYGAAFFPVGNSTFPVPSAQN